MESILRSRSEGGEDEEEEREAGDRREEELGGGEDRLNKADTEKGWADTEGEVVVGREEGTVGEGRVGEVDERDEGKVGECEGSEVGTEVGECEGREVGSDPSKKE